MKIRNDERLLVEAVMAFADARGLALTRLSHDWLLVLSDGTRQHTVFGYDIGLNSATALRVANDKAASFDVLAAAGVPMIEHRLFLEPIMHRFTGLPGNWTRILKAFEDFGGDVVVKANEGTSGNDVHRVTGSAELERVVHSLLSHCRSIAISPFVPLRAEKRFVVLDGVIELAYAKQRPAATGDGVRTVRQMAADAMNPLDAESFSDWLAGMTVAELDLVPEAGEPVSFGWRHNLGQGARAETLDPASVDNQNAAALALSAARAVGLRFGSVDIAEPAGDGVAMVMEVNAGVMLEHYGRQDADARQQVRAIFDKALSRVFP